MTILTLLIEFWPIVAVALGLGAWKANGAIQRRKGRKDTIHEFERDADNRERKANAKGDEYRDETDGLSAADRADRLRGRGGGRGGM